LDRTNASKEKHDAFMMPICPASFGAMMNMCKIEIATIEATIAGEAANA